MLANAPIIAGVAGLAATNEAERLAVAIEAMRSDPSTDHTVSRLAARAGMSRSSFAEAFRQRLGRSPMEYLRALRLDLAAEFLRQSQIPIKLVGVRVGYTSRTAFVQAFRQNFGVSPAAFRAAAVQPLPDDIHAVSQRLRLATGRSTELAWEVDLVTGKVWWSEGTFSSLGFREDARILSDVVRFHERIHPEDRARVVQSMQASCVDGDLTWHADFRFRKSSGDYQPIRSGCVILRDREGIVRRLIGAMQMAAQ